MYRCHRRLQVPVAGLNVGGLGSDDGCSGGGACRGVALAAAGGGANAPAAPAAAIAGAAALGPLLCLADLLIGFAHLLRRRLRTSL